MNNSEPSYRKNVRWWEAALVAIILTAFAAPLAYVHSVRWISGGADTAFLSELSRNIAYEGKPYTQLNASVNAAEKLWGMEGEKVCQSSLEAPYPPEMNQFKRHTYLILYALAPFLWVAPVSVVLPSAMVTSFIVLLFAMYLLLREQSVPVWGAFPFIVAVSLFPAWSYGVQGQIYADRLYVGLTGLFLYLLSRRKEPSAVWLVVSAMLAASVVERGALILGGVIIAYAVLYAPSQSWRKTRLTFLLGGAVFLAAIAILKGYLESPYYQGFVSGMFLNFPNLLENPDYVAKLKLFLFLNLGFFGPLAIFAPRPFFMALLAMSPNILATVGGAEKTGWLTHYHSIYFPFIVWAAAMGMANIWRLATYWPLRFAVTAGVCGLGGIVLITNPGANLYGPVFSKTYIDENAWVQTYTLIQEANDPGKKPLATWLAFNKAKYLEINNAVPAGKSVTTGENVMPSLILNHEVHYYPIAIESADYALLPASRREDGGYRYYGEINYRGEDDRRTLNLCLNRRLKEAGYNIDTPERLLGGLYLIKRGATLQ